jgi:hypothetical protein
MSQGTSVGDSSSEVEEPTVVPPGVEEVNEEVEEVSSSL